MRRSSPPRPDAAPDETMSPAELGALPEVGAAKNTVIGWIERGRRAKTGAVVRLPALRRRGWWRVTLADYRDWHAALYPEESTQERMPLPPSPRAAAARVARTRAALAKLGIHCG